MTDNHIKINDSHPRVSHTADGVATTFAAPFPFLNDDDLSVWVNGLQMSLGTNYSVTGAGDSAGGTVTFHLTPEIDAEIVIARDMDISRTSDFLAGSALRAAALNTELDTLTMVSQELQAASQRTVRAPLHDIGTLAELPVSADRAGRLLSFDTNGDPEIGPLRSSVDLANQIANAEANAVAAATSAEAAAATVADEVAAVDMDEIQANHQACIRAAPYMLPVTFPSVPVLAHHRASLLFSPAADGEMHTYRTTDSGAWHLNVSSVHEQWFDLSHLGIGQEFKAAVRHGGTGSIVISPGTDNAGTDNVISPFAAGENFRIHAGESMVVVARSTNNNGGYIGEVVQYSANPWIVTSGSAHRLIENALGLFDGDSFYNVDEEFEAISLPTGYMIDTAASYFSYPLLSAVMNATGDVSPPRIQIPDREYTVTMTSGDFQIGETVNSSGGAMLRVDYMTNGATPPVTKIGLDFQSGSVPATSETLTGATSTATAIINAVDTISDLPGAVTDLTIHNPGGLSRDLRIHWRNLEKYS